MEEFNYCFYYSSEDEGADQGEAFVTVDSEDSDEVSNQVFDYLDLSNDVTQFMFLSNRERRPKSAVEEYTRSADHSLY